MAGSVTISITPTPDLPGRWKDVPHDEALVVLRVLEHQHFAAQRYLARLGAGLAKTPLGTKYRRRERAFYLAMRSLQDVFFWHAETGECAKCGGKCQSERMTPRRPRCVGHVLAAGASPAPDAPKCCDRAGEYNGFASGPILFECPGQCMCHD